jgi:hypothetical protein
VVLALLGGCSGISDNDDGIASIEIRLPANFYLEKDQTVQIRAVARSAEGDSVAADFRWRSPDSTVAVDSSLGLITALVDTGTARIQAALFGRDTLLSILDSLRFTLTAAADSGVLTTPDSITVASDTTTTVMSFQLLGGNPPVGVAGRPVSFRIVEPSPPDSAVVFGSGRVRDSVLTGTTGVATLTIRGRSGRTIPDRVVVEIDARRASGALIPGSGRHVVIRFLHQNP